MLLVALAIVLATTRANAGVSVRGSVDDVDAAKLAQLVELEVGSAADVEDVVIDLEDGRARISLTRASGPPRERILELSSSGGGDVERTVALFVGELSREEEEQVAEPAGAAPSVPGAPAATEVAPERSRVPERAMQSSLSLLAGAKARVIGGDLFLGPFLGGDVAVTKRLRLGLSGHYASASTEVAGGRVHAELADVGATAAYRVFASGRAALDAGLAVEAAWIGGHGEGADARSASGFGVAGTAFAQVTWAIARPVLVAFALEGGLLGPGLDLRADGRTALGVFGPLAGVSVAVGFAQ